MIRTLLIANRGEIACRIMRTAQRMGIATVAVHSDADHDALHVAMADRAVRIGGPLPADSYLVIAAIIEAARRSGADAIHPGYGFLSENADFAEACAEAGMVFVGPSTDAISAMGDKAGARRMMAEAGVPIVPGYDGHDQSDERMGAEAERIGYPLLVKATAGGGGRGMRRVDRAEDFPEALESARREARNVFGGDSVLLERFVSPARHIEVQLLGDRHGDVIHLGERDCSTQRRHQKVMEEQPSPFVDARLREKLCAAAISAARAVDYVGAGTVEFIVDARGDFHFLEMNTRLQVEHAVTELVTGLDLVEWQLRIADGEALPDQDSIRFRGHAIEARIYAEDPAENFAPQTGRIMSWKLGAMSQRPGIRVDSGVREGDEVTPFYDPMIAKVIAHGGDRTEAIARLEAAIRNAPIMGLRTNTGLLLSILRSEEFRGGAMRTGFLDDGHLPVVTAPEPLGFALAAAAHCLAPGGDWFRSSGVARPLVSLSNRDETRKVALTFQRGRLTMIEVDGDAIDIERVRLRDGRIVFARADVDASAPFLAHGRNLWLFLDDGVHLFSEADPLSGPTVAHDPGRIVAPLAGIVSLIAIAPGDQVEAGQTVAVIEAMKMETRLSARAKGTVKAVHARAGRQVRGGDLLVEILPDPPGD